MLTIPAARRCPGLVFPLVALVLAVAVPGGVRGQAAPPASAGGPQRPPGFLLLEERQSLDGLRVVGVYGAVAESTSGLWRVQLWEQLRERVIISTDKVNCSTSGPLRIPGRGRRLVVRELNPGGTITPANRLDHLIWWAVCHPQQAGRDPATLAPLARQLGFDGQRPEREQVLPGF
ncbi:MAG: hypothetical protein ACKO6F_07050 [Cyanobium sp.]